MDLNSTDTEKEPLIIFFNNKNLKIFEPNSSMIEEPTFILIRREVSGVLGATI